MDTSQLYSEQVIIRLLSPAHRAAIEIFQAVVEIPTHPPDKLYRH